MRSAEEVLARRWKLGILDVEVEQKHRTQEC